MVTLELRVRGAVRAHVQTYSASGDARRRAEHWVRTNSAGDYYAILRRSDGTVERIERKRS